MLLQGQLIYSTSLTQIGYSYQIPNVYCNNRQTTVIPTQQHIPKNIAVDPVFTNIKRLQLRPTAAIDMTIRNLLRSFNGTNASEDTPHNMAIEVTREASTNITIKRGTILCYLNLGAC